jgi:hypothetical protein
MNLSFRCSQKLEQRPSLDHSQRLGLKCLISLEQKLRSPIYEYVTKGFEGLQIAHKILQEKDSSGILIGGLAESIWSQRRKKEELYKHNDVDVMVLDNQFEFKLFKKFEGGIDWWLPQLGYIDIKSDYADIEDVEKKWWKNGNGAILSFGVEKDFQLNQGLYLPNREWIINMREYEVNANIDYERIEVDDEVSEKFRERIEKRVGLKLPKFIKEKFKNHILSPDYECYEIDNVVKLVKFDLDTIRAIKKSY